MRNVEIRPGMSATGYLSESLRVVNEDLSDPDLPPEELLPSILRKAVLESGLAVANHLGQVMPVQTLADKIAESVFSATLNIKFLGALSFIRPEIELPIEHMNPEV